MCQFLIRTCQQTMNTIMYNVINVENWCNQMLIYSGKGEEWKNKMIQMNNYQIKSNVENCLIVILNTWWSCDKE